MPPLGTFAAYLLHLSLSSCCIEDWAFSEKSIYITAITFSVLFHLHLYTTKTQKHVYLLFPVKLANQYPSSSWVRQPFLYVKDTTIDHLGVINIACLVSGKDTWDKIKKLKEYARRKSKKGDATRNAFTSLDGWFSFF
jgi:hypothetical protein